MKKGIVLSLALVVISTSVFANGGQQQSEGSPASAGNVTSATSEKGGVYTADSFTYKLVENTTGKKIRIAVLCVLNNPFWNDVITGVYAAKAVLALPQYNCTVDFISINDFLGQDFSDAIEACIVKGYDGICTVGVADSIVPAIDKAVAAGIKVYVFNVDTIKESKRYAFVGQDLFAAGGLAGETLSKMIGGQGKVGIIMGYNNVYGHQLRLKGAQESFAKYPGIRIVSTVENHDSGDDAYSIARDMMTANPDLKGIYVVAGGPHGAAKAIKDLGKTNSVSLVCFDFTDEIIPYLRSGDIDATIGQGPFEQGADPAILAYNHAVSGKPTITGNAFTKMDIVNKENVNQFFPE